MSKRRFFPILDTSNSMFFLWPGVGGSAAWGAPRHRTLIALGRSWGKPLVGSRRSRILELTLMVDSAGLLDPWCHRRVGLTIEWGPAASEIYSLCFFWSCSWNHGTAVFSWSNWGRLVPESSCGGCFSSRIAANFTFPLRVKAPLCKDFSV